MSVSIYTVFNNWLFDQNPKSEIPSGEYNLTKYNSPIHHVYMLRLFMKNPKFNHFLNEYFNNINVRYLTKEEMMKFLKKCVVDFRITRRDITFVPRKQSYILFDTLKEIAPELKSYDLTLLCDIIEKSEDREAIYNTLDLGTPPKREKVSIKNKKIDKKDSISLKDVLGKYFTIM